MKLKYIILTVLSALVVVGSGLIYMSYNSGRVLRSDSARPKAISKAHSKKSVSEHSISSSIASSIAESNVIIGSGADYQINKAEDMGGVLAKLTAITKIIDKSTALDIIASNPNLNGFKLISIVNNGDNWDAKINSNGIDYSVSLFHYTDNIGLISLSDNVNYHSGYSFVIPENLYSPYREVDKKLRDDFSRRLSALSSSSDELTKDEAVALANKYVTGSNGANTDPFKFETQNGNVYYLRTDIKKGNNGIPDTATYATVELQDNNNVHITAGVWTSKTFSHAPFYDKIVSR